MSAIVFFLFICFKGYCSSESLLSRTNENESTLLTLSSFENWFLSSLRFLLTLIIEILSESEFVSEKIKSRHRRIKSRQNTVISRQLSELTVSASFYSSRSEIQKKKTQFLIKKKRKWIHKYDSNDSQDAGRSWNKAQFR